MKRLPTNKTLFDSSYFVTRGIYWIVLAMLVPIAISYFQALRVGKMSVEQQANRVLEFFIAEADLILSKTERTMDAYLLDKQGSCASEDLIFLRRYMATHGSVVTMGLIAADGKVICSLGDSKYSKISFPPLSGERTVALELAELADSRGSLPILIKKGRNNVRIFSVLSRLPFQKLLVPGLLADYAQIDVVLPNGGLWFSTTGLLIVDGLSDDTIIIRSNSERFPIKLIVAADQRAAHKWSGSLRTSMLVIILLCFVVLAVFAIGCWLFRVLTRRQAIRAHLKATESAHSLFDVTYQPLLNLESRMLVGVVARADLSIFDAVPDERPTMAQIINIVWDEIGDFTTKRREFNLIIEVDGEDIVMADKRPIVIEELKAIAYEDLTLLMKWRTDKGFDADLYRPLKEVTSAGANLGIECGAVRFSLLSDMWAWPYHQLMVDFAALPDAEEAVVWISEIVMSMSEQLHVGTVALGLEDSTSLEYALSSGFEVGAGDFLGPPLTFDALMSAVRPARGKPKESESGSEQNEAA